MPPQKVQKVEVSIYWSLYDFTTLKEVEEEDLWGVCFIKVEGISIFISFVDAEKQSIGQIYQVHWGSCANR